MYFFYFYPLGLDRSRTRLPVLSWMLMAVMVVAFLWVKYAPEMGPVRPWQLIFFPGNGAPWTAVTALFLHGSWLHLIGNLVYFQVFAPPLEDRLGPFPFLVYLLIFGVFGNLVHGLVSLYGWLGQSGMGVLGASGAIAGLLAFSLVRFYDARVEIGWWVFAPLGGQNRAGRSRIPIVAAAALWLLLQVVQTLTANESGTAVSYGAHFGGFAIGLLLALGLGHFRQGRTEAFRNRAERYFRAGQYHAAAGEWTEYLDREPDCETGRLGMARSLQLIGQAAEARDYYRGLFDEHLKAGRIREALSIHDEACRGFGGECFGPDALARVAYYHEKQMDYAAAVVAHRQLYEAYPDRVQGQRSLVRLVELYRGKLGDPRMARRWYEEGERNLSPGAWREYLEEGLKPEAAPSGSESPDRPEPRPIPGS